MRNHSTALLFRSAVSKPGALIDNNHMDRVDSYRMVPRRRADAGFKIRLSCHVFRETGITAYLEAGGTLENAQARPRTRARERQSYTTGRPT